MKRFSSRSRLLLGALSALAVAACGSSPPACDSQLCGGNIPTSTTSTGGAGTGGSVPTEFLCKGITCQHAQEACSVTNTQGQGDTGECTPLPVICQMPGADCSCFGDLAGCTCQVVPPGNDFAIFCDKPL